MRVAMDAMGATFTSGEILRVIIHAVREQNIVLTKLPLSHDAKENNGGYTLRLLTPVSLKSLRAVLCNEYEAAI